LGRVPLRNHIRDVSPTRLHDAARQELIDVANLLEEHCTTRLSVSAIRRNRQDRKQSLLGYLAAILLCDLAPEAAVDGHEVVIVELEQGWRIGDHSVWISPRGFLEPEAVIAVS
jgi:hypothetical protein